MTGGELAGAGGLQQGVALFQHPVVVAARRGMLRNEADQQLVEEPAPVGRIALDQGQVLGRKEHRLADSQDVPGPDRVAAVDPAPVGPAGVDFQFQDGGLVPADQPGPDQGPFGTEAQQRARPS